MWIIEWSYMTDNEFKITAWSSENEALKQACSELVNHIQSLYVDPYSDLLDEIKIINKFIQAAEYNKAIQHWNNCSYNVSFDPMIWNIRHLTPKPYYGAVPTISFNFPLDLSFVKDVSINPAIVVDDHTCTLCGNTKCSSQESSCWKCGNPIS